MQKNKPTVNPKRVGAAKVMTMAGPVWCHMSESGNTLKLRRYSENAIFELNPDGNEVEQFIPLEKCKTLVKAESYSFRDIEVWTKIFQILEEGVVSQPKESKSKTPIIVPITPLRQFYETMLLLEKATWVNLAKFYSENPVCFERLWNKSQKVFQSYANEADWGRGETRDLPPVPAKAGLISSTNEFTAFVRQPKNSCSHETGFTYVERELNPRRTRQGVFSNRAPSTKSGTGGIDVLLKSKATGFPVVGEVKVGDDKNAFFGLVQAITYAVELSTPNQLARLKKHFGDNFKNLNVEEGKVEVVLLMVNPVKDATLDPVKDLISVLNERKKCRGLATITLIHNKDEKWISYSRCDRSKNSDH